MKKVDERLVGRVSVDSGMIWIGDPCYVIHSDHVDKALGKDWGDFVDMTLRDNQPQEIGNGLGIVSSTLYGDGSYPVYATLDRDGMVTGLRIDFSGNG